MSTAVLSRAYTLRKVMKVGENAVFSLFSFFKEWYKSSLYPKHSFSRKRKLQKACQWWVYTFWAKTVRFSEFWKTFPVEMLFFTQKIYIRKTKKSFKNAPSVFRKPLGDLHSYFPVFFFFLHCFLVCISEPIRNLFWDRDAFPKWNATSKQFLGCIHKKQLPKWTEIEKGFKFVVQT